MNALSTIALRTLSTVAIRIQQPWVRRRILAASMVLIALAAIIGLAAAIKLGPVRLMLFMVFAQAFIVVGVALYLVVAVTDLLRRGGVWRVHFAPGEVIFRQGDPGDFVYVIVKGQVALLRQDSNGTERLVVRRKEGDYLGEVSGIDQPRTVTARTLSGVDAIILAQADFSALYSYLPDFQRIVDRVVDLRRLRDPASLDQSALHAMWRGRSVERWADSPEVYRLLGERVLGVGDRLLAHDILSEGMANWPRDTRLRQLLALALAQSGATEKANAILRQLHEEGQADEETLGILARTHKDLWSLSTDPAERERHRHTSCELYSEAYKRTRGVWTGINAATMTLFGKDRKAARQLARAVRDLCRQELQRVGDFGGDAYWAEATLGEAAVILEEWDEAERWYSKAARTGQGRFRELGATRRQARLLCEFLRGDPHCFDHCFRIPQAVVFAGLMIDRPGRPTTRFPASLEEAVRREIIDRLDRLDAGIGFSSAACGSDILFLEAMIARGGEIHVVLPEPPPLFRRANVNIIPDAPWGERFDALLEKAAHVHTMGSFRAADRELAHDHYANLFLDGMSVLQAQSLDTGLSALAVWDGHADDGPEGIRSLVQHWHAHGRPLEVVDIGKLQSESSFASTPVAAAAPSSVESTTAGQVSTPRIPVLLVAEGGGYEKLTEEQLLLFNERCRDRITAFVKRFEEQLRKQPDTAIANHASEPLLSTRPTPTGLSIAISDLSTGGRFALELSDDTRDIEWAREGLPGSVGIRIALDVGPLDSNTATRVNRIQSITPPGHVYASQSFAALAAAEGVSGLTCDYVGQTPAARDNEPIPTYHVRRPGDDSPPAKQASERDA